VLGVAVGEVAADHFANRHTQHLWRSTEGAEESEQFAYRVRYKLDIPWQQGEQGMREAPRRLIEEARHSQQ